MCSDPTILIGITNPALRNSCYGIRMMLEYFLSELLYVRQQGCVSNEIGNLELHQACLTFAQDFARTAQFKIFLGYNKSVTAIAQHAKPLARKL